MFNKSATNFNGAQNTQKNFVYQNNLPKNKQVKKELNITVSNIQLKNPVLKDFFFGYNLETDKEKTLLYDFKVCDNHFCFFLSMKYHEAYPSYIEEKLTAFQNKMNDSTSTKVFKYLFCMVDISVSGDITNSSNNSKLENLRSNKLLNMNLDIVSHQLETNKLFSQKNNTKTSHNHTPNLPSEDKFEKLLSDLNFICINQNTALILCYSGYDIAQYIFSLSRLDTIDFGEEKIKTINFEENLIETLCTIEKINKNDATNLLSNFQDLKSICTASNQLLSLVPGINAKKIKSMEEFLKYEFSHFKIN